MRTEATAAVNPVRRWRRAALRWLPVVGYGAALAAGTVALQWLDYDRMARAHAGDIELFLLAAGFLALGVFVGVRVIGGAGAQPAGREGNPQAQAALGISAREMAVLRELAAGRSNKEIAIVLHISPNTVKTHLARLFDKLESSRRTEAIGKARALGLIG